MTINVFVQKTVKTDFSAILLDLQGAYANKVYKLQTTQTINRLKYTGNLNKSDCLLYFLNKRCSDFLLDLNFVRVAMKPPVCSITSLEKRAKILVLNFIRRYKMFEMMASE